MKIEGFKTRVFNPPADDIYPELLKVADKMPDYSVLAVTSKVISIAEGRCLPLSEFEDKDDLIALESDFFLPRELSPYRSLMLTLKNGRLIGSAGIDQSNADGHYILLPADPYASAELILTKLQQHRPSITFGVIITDSVSTPLRRGAIGSAVAWAGFDPVKSYGGQGDLFGRPFSWGRVNMADSLAAAAVISMGEGVEATPFVVLSDLSTGVFSDQPYDSSQSWASFEVPEAEDAYRCLYADLPWRRGGGGYRFER